MSDGCGIYVEYSSGASCVDSTTVDPNNYQTYSYQVYSTNSFCVNCNLGTITLPSSLQSRCYPYVCNNNNITFTIGPYSITCLSNEGGVQKSLSALTGKLTCPVFSDFCTNSRKTCPNFCNQNGYCADGVCNCNTGFFGSTCTITSCAAS